MIDIRAYYFIKNKGASRTAVSYKIVIKLKTEYSRISNFIAEPKLITHCVMVTDRFVGVHNHYAYDMTKTGSLV